MGMRHFLYELNDEHKSSFRIFFAPGKKQQSDIELNGIFKHCEMTCSWLWLIVVYKEVINTSISILGCKGCICQYITNCVWNPLQPASSSTDITYYTSQTVQTAQTTGTRLNLWNHNVRGRPGPDFRVYATTEIFHLYTYASAILH